MGVFQRVYRAAPADFLFMNIGEILFNAAGGGVLGSALHVVTDYFDNKNKIAMLNAQMNAAEKTEAWKAFSASQGGNESLTIPQNVPVWVASFYVCVDGVKQLTRPLLTWAAIAVITMVYINATPEARAAMASEIIFGSFTAIFWWFGARYQKGTK